MRIFRTKHYEDWFLRLKDYAGRTAITDGLYGWNKAILGTSAAWVLA